MNQTEINEINKKAKPSIIFNKVSKKFNKGYVSDSLRDALVKPFKSIFNRDGRLLVKNNKEFWALKDISFQVYPGEALGIIGPNGGGKTTTLKLLSCILRPDQGRIVVHGKVGALIELAAGFNPDLTGRENVYLYAAILGMNRQEIQQKYDEIVEFAELQDFMETPIKWYSTGMYARLGFAVAAHINPQILLVDEVLSVGDLGFQKRCIDKMYSFKKEGITIVFVSHNMQAIASLCDRVIILDKGKLAANGKTEEMITKYLKGVNSISKDRTDNHIFFEKGILYNKDSVKCGLFKSGEIGYVEFSIKFERDFSSIYATVFVRKKNGNFVFGVDTTRFIGKSLSVKKGQTLTLKVRLTFNLVLGEYELGTAVFDVTDPVKEYEIYTNVFANIIIEDAIGNYGTAYLEPILINKKIQ